VLAPDVQERMGLAKRMSWTDDAASFVDKAW
jgi:hypothetical protein